MFCQKCGKENPDSSVFCKNCGEKINIADEHLEFKKTIINTIKEIVKEIGGIIAWIVVFIFIVQLYLSNGDSYIETVKNHAPIINSETTYGQLANRYITNAQWDYNESDGKQYVSVEGTVKNTDSNILLRLQVEDLSDSVVYITPNLMIIDDNEFGQIRTSLYITKLVNMYDDGIMDLSDTSRLYN